MSASTFTPRPWPKTVTMYTLTERRTYAPSRIAITVKKAAYFCSGSSVRMACARGLGEDQVRRHPHQGHEDIQREELPVGPVIGEENL